MAKDLRRAEWVPPVISRSSNPQGRNVRFGSKADIPGKREPPVGMVFPTYLLLPARSCSTAWSSVKLPGR